MAILGPILAIGSAVIGAVGQIKQGQAAAQAAEYNAQISANNAVMAQRFAADARARGDAEVERQRVQTAQLIGTQRAVLGSRNIDLGSGVAISILGDTAAFGELDALTLRHNYEREAIGFETQAGDFSAESALGRLEAKNARTAGWIGAAGSALTGFNQVGQGMGWF